ncbi:MAG: CHAD domain-containing protein [Candidatus Solibacter sp.]|nr:CHAD domain-containing protein [Candidatus Solibacter sp.]
MREFVRLQTGVLLRGLASQVNRASRTGDPDAIHDLRVAIRRLSRCLRLFARFYPAHSWKKVRRRLASLMDVCGTVRDRDIAIELLRKARVPPVSPLLRQLYQERLAARLELRRQLLRWKQRAFSRRWRLRLGL